MSKDIDIEHRLEEIEERVTQNNKILRSIKRKQSFDFWFGIIKILIFVGVFYWSYLFIQPALDQIKESYVKFQGIGESVDSLKGFNFSEIFKPKAQ